MKNIFTHDNFKKACEWVWDKKYYILMIVIIVFLVITQFKSCQKYKDLKTISDNNIIALTDSVHHYKTKNGELAASKVLLLGDIETLKLANEDLAKQVKNLKLKEPQTIVVVQTETQNQEHNQSWEASCDTTIHKEFDFSDDWRKLSGSVDYADEQLSLNIDSDKVYADYTFDVEDNQVYVTSNNPYILYNDIYGITMPEYEPTWSLVVGPSLFLGYDPIGHARISQGDLPFSVGVGVSLTIGYNIKSGGKKTISYKKKK